MFKGLADLAGLLQKARDVQAQAGQMQARLALLRVEGTAGGGMVTVVASGALRLMSCRIEPSLLASGDRELVEDLVLSAANQALEKAREAAAEEMHNLAGGLDLPGVGDALAGLGLGSRP